MEEYIMDHIEKYQTGLIQSQNRYIRQLEEQLTVYEQKDKAQEQLIEKLNEALSLFAEELSMLKAETGEKDFQEE